MATIVVVKRSQPIHIVIAKGLVPTEYAVTACRREATRGIKGRAKRHQARRRRVPLQNLQKGVTIAVVTKVRPLVSPLGYNCQPTLDVKRIHLPNGLSISPQSYLL